MDEVCLGLLHDATHESLVLDKFKIDDDQLESLSRVLGRNISLEKLFLRGSHHNFTHIGLAHLAEALKVNMRLVVLDLSNSILNCAGVASRSRFLGHNDTISILKLNDASIVTEQVGKDSTINVSGLLNFSKQLAKNRGLTKLYLRGNALTDFGSEERGLGSILVACNQHVCLSQVDLSYNSLGKSGAQLIFSELVGNHVLLSLDLSGNRIKSQGLIEIAKYLKENPPLQKLFLRDNHLMNNNMIGIESLIKSLDANIINEDDRPAISFRNTNLWLLDVLDNHGDELEPLLADLLKRNHFLSDIKVDNMENGLIGRRIILNEAVQRLLESGDPSY